MIQRMNGSWLDGPVGCKYKTQNNKQTNTQSVNKPQRCACSVSRTALLLRRPAVLQKVVLMPATARRSQPVTLYKKPPSPLSIHYLEQRQA